MNKYRLKAFRSAGFTLIELIIVIVILGILAVVALPKFIDVGTEARISTLKAFKASLKSTADMAASKCLTSTTCNEKVSGNLYTTALINGQNIYFHYGYPTAWGRFHVDDGVGGIEELMSIEGFTAQAHVPNTFQTVFTLNEAPNPTQCSVIYQMSGDGTLPLLRLTLQTDGC